jgi:hypothetical protein
MKMEEYEDVTFTQKNIKRTIKLARAGDVNAAKRLLEIYCMAMSRQNRKSPICPFLLNYVAKCFECILADDASDVRACLNLKHKSRRPNRPDKWVRDLRLAIEVEDRRLKGLSYEDAVVEVVGLGMGASQRTIERAYAASQAVLHPFK